jgi:two-component system, OmpR family, sensor histidine kinase KdpD
MLSENEIRRDPDAILQALKKEEERTQKAKLKIFFGMCAGVGKTYDMLKASHEAKSKGINVAIGYVETHKRPETEALVSGLAVIPRKKLEYRGTMLEEMDLDAILAAKPKLVLVDELAHSNAPGSRHTKRYQDVQELLENGIDVYTTVNVQHLESRADTVAQITGSMIRETVPDSIFDQADEIEIIDLPPDELLKRLSEGKVYTQERSQQAIQNFFRKGNLTALREMALRLTAERVDHQLRDFMQTERITGPWKSGQRIVVGISPSPQSTSLIRWARRMAYTMNATWIAVYVERSVPLSDAAKIQLSKNIKLARELGAEILTTSDDDIAQALPRVANQQNATQILVGKSRHKYLLRKNLLDRLIENSGTLDIYVVGGTEEDDARKRKFRLPEIQSGLAQYFIAAAVICAVALICFPVTSFLGYQTVSLILLLAVALLPLRFGVGPVLLAAALSALVWDLLFIPPRFTFVVAKGQDILMLVTYFAIAAVTGTLTVRIRAREKAVRQREERAIALYTLTKDLSNATTQDEVAHAAVSNFKKFFETEVAVFLSEPDGDIFTKAHSASSYEVDAKEFSVASWVYWNEKKAGKNTDTLPFAQATYYPMSGPRYPLGVVGVKLSQNHQLTIDQEALLQNFLTQIASTLEREQLNEIAKKSIAFVESEKLYKTLFNSISHELRTPVAAILTASEALLDEHSSNRLDLQRDLAGEIHTASGRLNRLIGNLLDMTRLESGRITPALDWCDIHDLINSAVHKLEHELANHNIAIDVPSDFPLMKMDFGLMEQAIVNILHNATVYTPAGSQIKIRSYLDGEVCTIDISDNGPGFPTDSLPRIFEKFYRVPGTQSGGSGLGLSIARGFVEAHKGVIKVANKQHGGAQFTISIPTQKNNNNPAIEQ